MTKRGDLNSVAVHTYMEVEKIQSIQGGKKKEI